MATRDHDPETGLVGGFRSVVRLLVVVAFTGVETAALVAWLGFVGNSPAVSRAAVAGIAVLVAGLFLEHVLTDLAVNGADLSFPVGTVAALSASEAVLWALWLAIAERVGGADGLLVAGVVFAVLLVPQHSIEDAVLRGRAPLSNPLVLGTVGFSVVESAGATLWLLFASRPEPIAPRLAEVGLAGVDPAVFGVGILAASLFVEHVVGVTFSRRA